MLSITITTSLKTTTFMLDVPVNDTIQLHYDECDYCEKMPVRRESVQVMTRKNHLFCSPYHRKVFCEKKIDSVSGMHERYA